MYNLGEQFKFDYSKALANEQNIIRGDKYRFTILSERLIRLEYDENGIFEDRPTELVWFRNMNPVKYLKEENKKILKIKTNYFELIYVKNKHFNGTKLNPISNLKVNLLNTDRMWYYNHPEVRNYGSPSFSIDDSKTLDFQKGLYSVDGFSSIDDSNSFVFTQNGTLEERQTKSIDIYLFMYLKDFALCLKDYFMITGYPQLLPKYAFGNWWSKNAEYNFQDIKRIVSKFENNDIPLSVIILDHKWHLSNKNSESGFSWNNKLFDNSLELSRFLHDRNIFLGLNINPVSGIYSYEKNFEILTKYLEKDETGKIPFNTLAPKFIDAYLKILIHPLENDGVDFFFIDIKDKKNINDLSKLNHYHFFDKKLNNKRSFVLSRNSFVASHRNNILYTGKTIVSWDTLKMIPYYNVSAANMGISYMAYDVGGYYKGIEDNELYTRYVQLGVFSPILKLGSENGKYYKRAPWLWGTKTYYITKNYLKLRHKLIPYIYSESYKYYKYGAPMILPLYYSVPKVYDDVNYRNEYSFGSELFICPITSKKEYLINRVIHKFYLPKGTWYDFTTGKKFIGDKKYTTFFKDEDYPVFVKKGAIIPLNNDRDLNKMTPPKNLEIQIFPGENGFYKLYEDDGVSKSYKSGNYLLSLIEYNYMPNNYSVIIRPIEGKTGIVPEKRNYKIIFKNTKEAEEVMVNINGNQLEYKKYVHDNDFIIEVENASTLEQLTIGCRGKNIEIEATRIINDDIESIISDLQIETSLKEQIDSIFFDDSLTIKKKRIKIRKLTNKGLEKNLVKLFLKLLEYVSQIN